MFYRYLHGEKILDNRGIFKLPEKVITRSNSWKLKLHKFRLKIRCIFLILKVINDWNNLIRDVMDSLSFGVFQSRLDGYPFVKDTL